MPTSITRPRRSPNVFSSVSGAILGFFLYPLRSLVNTAMSIIFIIPMNVISFGIWIAQKLSLSNRVLQGILNIIGVVLSFLVLAPIATFLLPGYIVVDLITQSFKGLKEGWQSGITTVFKNVATKWEIFSSFQATRKRLFGRDSLEQTDNDNLEGAPGPVPGSVPGSVPGPVPRSSLEALDLRDNSTHPSFEKLTDDELQAAETVAEKTADKALENQIKRYRGLFDRLTKLDNAIDTRKRIHGELSDQLKTAYDAGNDDLALNDIEDELIPGMDVFNPVLLVKKMEVNGDWHVVPISTYITDGFSTDKWSQHPLTNDNLAIPDFVNGHKTCYSWHQYTGYSQELAELTSSIRTAISDANTLKDKISSFLSKMPPRHTLFGSKTPKVADPEEGNTNVDLASYSDDAENGEFADDDDDDRFLYSRR